MKNKTVLSITMVLIDFLLLVLFIFFIPSLLVDLVGFDVTEYENWSGELQNQVVFRLGAGFWEVMIILIKMIGFITGQCAILKDKGNVQKMIFIVLHIVIGILGLIYVFRFGHGPNLVYLIQTLSES